MKQQPHLDVVTARNQLIKDLEFMVNATFDNMFEKDVDKWNNHKNELNRFLRDTVCRHFSADTTFAPVEPIISETGEPIGKGSQRFKSVEGLTEEEQQAVVDGYIVLVRCCVAMRLELHRGQQQ